MKRGAEHQCVTWRRICEEIEAGIQAARLAPAAWSELNAKIPMVNRAFNKVRGELEEVGLLGEKVYLDEIDLNVSPIPSLGEAGYVFEKDDWYLPFLWAIGVTSQQTTNLQGFSGSEPLRLCGEVWILFLKANGSHRGTKRTEIGVG